jgi:hypothetical protein
MTISSTINWQGSKVTFTWIPTKEPDQYTPIKNVSGICLNENEEVLICREPGQTNWGLPGGGPETEETPIETLKRELMEEPILKLIKLKQSVLKKSTFQTILKHLKEICSIKLDILYD